MTTFIDFSAVKDAVSFEETIDLLKLNLKRAGNQFRGPCPSCANAGDRALVVTEGRGFYCWGQRKGGDQIALAAHVLELPAKEAAQELAVRAGIVPSQERDSTSGKVPSRTVPESEGAEGSKLSPLSYLEHDHEAVYAVGFDPEKAKAMGIGYAPRGIMRGVVAVPIFDFKAALAAGVPLKGYIGITEAKLPSDFTSTVVPLQKRA